MESNLVVLVLIIRFLLLGIYFYERICIKLLSLCFNITIIKLFCFWVLKEKRFCTILASVYDILSVHWDGKNEVFRFIRFVLFTYVSEIIQSLPQGGVQNQLIKTNFLTAPAL